MKDSISVELIGTNQFIEVPKRELVVRLGANGILFQGDSVLVFNSINRDLFDVPGGGIKPGETQQEALCREFLEESGVEVRPIRLLHVMEKFVKFNDEPVPWQAVRVYYLVKQVGGKIKPEGNGNDSKNVRFVPVRDLNEQNTINAEILEAVRLAQAAR